MIQENKQKYIKMLIFVNYTTFYAKYASVLAINRKKKTNRKLLTILKNTKILAKEKQQFAKYQEGK